MMSKVLFAFAFTLLPRAFATVSMTSPVATTTCQAGQPCKITWIDDGKAPSLTDFGLASIGVWVGSVNSQSEVQHIQDGVNVATTAEVDFTVDPSIGPNFNKYFVRFTSAAAKDPNNPQFNVEAFSAMFTLSGMSGQFNQTIQDQINGASTAPIPSPSAPAATTPNGGADSGAPSSSHAASGSASGSKSGASSTPTGAAAALAPAGVTSVFAAALLALIL